MKFLLDTHIIVWLACEPERVDATVAERLRQSDAELLLSVASWWELAVKHAAGRLETSLSPMQLREAWLRRQNVSEVPIIASHALEAAALPPIHKDPFDRMLAAQARIEGATLVTVDPFLSQYGITTLAAKP